MRNLRKYVAPYSPGGYGRRPRHKPRRDQHPRRNPRTRRRNPMKRAALEKAIEKLHNLGLDAVTIQQLSSDLSHNQVDASQAKYLLDWWIARLSLLRLEEESLTPKEENALIEVISNYGNSYKVRLPLTEHQYSYSLQHPDEKVKKTMDSHALSLDGELKIENYGSLRHFVHLATTNTYFSFPWPKVLHRVYFTIPEKAYREASDELWLGKLAKRRMPLTKSIHGFEEKDPAMKLLRGAYIADPADSELETQIPLALISKVDETRRPSDMIEFLTDIEANVVTDRIFTPEYHEPFMTFADGKSWVVVNRDDYAAGGRSLSDCGSGQYNSHAIAIISLREPVPNTEPQQYKAQINAEIVFPSDTPINAGYNELKTRVGVCNQLRGFGNSKPISRWHPYIIPLLKEGWITHFVIPRYEGHIDVAPGEFGIFWPSIDLTNSQIESLKETSDYLFDANKFYKRFQELNYPWDLKEQIIDGIEFPISYVIEQLEELTEETTYGRASGGWKIVKAAIKRGVAGKKAGNLTPELAELLDLAEQRMLHTETPSRVVTQLSTAGAELSTPQIYQRLKAKLEQDEDRLADRRALPRRADRSAMWDVVMISLQRKIERGDEDLESLLEVSRELLLQGISGTELLRIGVTLSISRTLQLLQEYIEKSVWPRHPSDGGVVSEEPYNKLEHWYIIINTLRNMVKLNQDMEPLLPAIKEIILVIDRDQDPFSAASDLAALPVTLTEEEIIYVFLDQDIYQGRSHAALVSLKRKLETGSRKSMTKMLRAAQMFLSRVKDPHIAREALDTVELPMKDVIAAIEAKSLNMTIRKTALKTLQKRVNRGNKYLRARAVAALENLLLRTKNKNLITSILDVFNGHQQKNHMISFFIRNRIEWVSHPKNYNFLIDMLVRMSSGSGTSWSSKIMDSPTFHLYRELAQGKLVTVKDDGHEIVLRIIYEMHFDKSSMKAVRLLLEAVLDRIIADPEKLTRKLCNWYQEEYIPGSGGWGSSGHTTHRGFSNIIPLSRKLEKQFKALGRIAREGDRSYQAASQDCYLDLVLTIASKMPSSDKKKLFKIVSPFIKDMVMEEDSMFKKSIGRYLGYSNRRRNPIDTSGLICDFCGGIEVIEIHNTRPIQLGGRLRTQHMSCSSCSQLVATRNIRGLISLAANMLPPEIRRQVRIHFREVFQLFFGNLLDTFTIAPSHIFDLQMLRARSLNQKCSIRSGHPALGACNDLAYIEIDLDGWKKACMVCATDALGADEISQILMHPDIRNLRNGE